MGADFILYALPACRFDDARITEMKQLIKELDEKELPEDNINDPPQPRELLETSFDDYLDSVNGREAMVMGFTDWPYDMVFSGGMSWGDTPTDIANSMDVLIECNKVWYKLEEWARADKAGSGPYRPPATPAMLELARTRYVTDSDDNIAIDDDALTSVTDTGIWVQAWVWLDGESLGKDSNDAN